MVIFTQIWYDSKKKTKKWRRRRREDGGGGGGGHEGVGEKLSAGKLPHLAGRGGENYDGNEKKRSRHLVPSCCFGSDISWETRRIAM